MNRASHKKKRPVIKKRHREVLYALSELCERFHVQIVGGRIKCYSKSGDSEASYGVGFVSADMARAYRLPDEASVEVWVAGPERKRLAERVKRARKKKRARSTE